MYLAAHGVEEYILIAASQRLSITKLRSGDGRWLVTNKRLLLS
jgi:hypothetical protein